MNEGDGAGLRHRVTAPGTTGSRSKLVALIVATAFFMQNLDGAIITTSLPQMAASFGVRPLDLSIGVTAYLIAVAALIPVSGWLSDRLGARALFAGSILIFTLASIGCGAAQSLAQFTAMRVVQGAGGALMATAGRLIVLRHATKAELLDVTALITWPALIAPVIGPALGGFITTYASWRWNFLLNIPIGALGLACVLAFVPAQQDEPVGRFDWTGFVLSATALVALLAGLEGYAGQGRTLTAPTLLVLSGLGVGALAVRHFRRATAPLLDLAALDHPTFALSTLGPGFTTRIAINAVPFLLPLLFQLGFGLSAADAGLLILVYFLGNLGMKAVTTPTLRRHGFRTTLIVSGVIGSGAIAACALLTATTPMWVTGAVLLVAGLTRSMQFTAINTIAFADVTPAQRGSATALSAMMHHVTMVLGVAGAAVVLNLAQAAAGRSESTLADFAIAFAATGALALASAMWFRRLAPGAGAEVTGATR
jgi:EmrB/QacA subfamily drug resistance transporter